MLKLMQTKDLLQVVQDQQGSPCWAYGLSGVIWRLINTNVVISGIYHWADSGYCSRYDFALEIQTLGLKLGLLSHKVQIMSVDSEQIIQAAIRPGFSALDSTLLRNTLSLPVLSWQEQLERALRSFSAVQVN
jgi:dTDP-4-dehydrorhamnose reductase